MSPTALVITISYSIAVVIGSVISFAVWASTNPKQDEAGDARARHARQETVWLFVVLAALFALVFVVFWPSFSGGFVWDDRPNVSENEHVRVLRVRFGPREKGATHEHILNRVVLYLNDQTNAKADDVRMAGAATQTRPMLTARIPSFVLIAYLRNNSPYTPVAVT